MVFTTLISTADLFAHIGDADWAVVDCRFSLDDIERGRLDYEREHISGAVYAHLEEDLSAPIIPGKTGRHPLPEIETLARRFSHWGIDASTQVVAYDDGPGPMAARLWWLLRWLGHDAVAVLDGGWFGWKAEGRPVSSGVDVRRARVFNPQPRAELVTDAAGVLETLGNPNSRLVDARAVERFRGEVEPLDPVAGHIPGAVCAPYTENLNSDGHFLSPEQLRTRFEAVLGEVPPERAVFYCGSGVTAAHNLLALAHAGLGDARLYVGSWSDWITDPTRPIEKS
jgi:thiosulfate/3-mercaptopyruvate sulfurtransferase